MLLVFGGVGLAQANLLSAVGAVVCILVGYVARIRVEEDVLEAAFGDEYRGLRLDPGPPHPRSVVRAPPHTGRCREGSTGSSPTSAATR